MEFVDVGVELAMLCLLREAPVEGENVILSLYNDDDGDAYDFLLKEVDAIDAERNFRCLEAAVEMSSGSSFPETLLCSTATNCSRWSCVSNSKRRLVVCISSNGVFVASAP